MRHGLKLVYLLLLIGGTAGCQSMFSRATWLPAEIAIPSAVDPHDSVSTLALAESAYADAMHREANGDATCVDRYFQATTIAWADVEHHLHVHGRVPCSRASVIYHSALTKLITAGQRFRRFDPRGGVTIWCADGWQTIPTNYHAFPWRPEDFDHLVPVGDYATKDVKNVYSNYGLGVPTVALRCRRPEERFRRERQVFAATVVLRPTSNQPISSAASFVLDLYDPMRIESVTVTGMEIPLRRDITAPIVYALKDEQRRYLDAFLQPGSTTNTTGLFMIEPYQPGKTPVVFVHGLLSDPFTWANLANEIRASPDLRERYQIWGFEYATGEPFLLSAAALRRQLLAARRQLDPHGIDPALSRIVLVGHSMGGLVSKLQVSYSGDQLWRSVSNHPLQNVVTTSATRANLTEAFFFEPLPIVSRVVFVGTPHRGSVWAQRPIGRLGAALVDEPSSMQAEHAQLVRDNPNAFSPEFMRRIPTSIDLLRPDSPLLRAIDGLAIAPDVKLHSIIGSGYWMLGSGDSDGVVPVSSAQIGGVVSQKLVHSKHGEIHQTTEGTRELLRILRSHSIASAAHFSRSLAQMIHEAP